MEGESNSQKNFTAQQTSANDGGARHLLSIQSQKIGEENPPSFSFAESCGGCAFHRFPDDGRRERVKLTLPGLSIMHVRTWRITDGPSASGGTSFRERLSPRIQIDERWNTESGH